MDRKILGWFIVVLMLCSCGTQKVITEYKEQTLYDTLVIEKHDTIKQTEVKIKRDTLIEKHNIVHIITEKGDTAKTVENHDTYHGTFQNDSVDYYKAVADLYKEIIDESNKYQAEEQVIKSQNVIDGVKEAFIYAIILATIILLTIIIWRVKK